MKTIKQLHEWVIEESETNFTDKKSEWVKGYISAFKTIKVQIERFFKVK